MDPLAKLIQDLGDKARAAKSPQEAAVFQTALDSLAPPEPPMTLGADAGIADPWAAPPPPGHPAMGGGRSAPAPPPPGPPVHADPGFNAVTGGVDAPPSPYDAMFNAPPGPAADATGALGPQFAYDSGGPPTGQSYEGAPPADPNAPPPAPAAAPAQAGMPFPSFQEAVGMMGGPGRGPNLGPQIKAARGALAESAAGEQAAYDAVQAGIAQRAAEEHAYGQAQAANLAGTAKEYEAQQAEADQRRAAVEAEHADYIQRRDQALADYQKQSEGTRVSELLGGNVVAGIALALGAFGAAKTGGPNLAMQVIQARVAEEARVRSEKLDAAKGRMDALDRAVLGAERGIQSEDARRAMYTDALLGKAKLYVDRQAALHGSDDKAAAYRQLGLDIADARALADTQGKAAALAALQKRQAAGAGKQLSLWDKLMKYQAGAKTGAEIAKLTASAIPEGISDDKMPAGMKIQIGIADAANGALDDTIRRVEQLKAEGRDTLPGYESAILDLDELAARKWREGVQGGMFSGAAGKDTKDGGISVRGLSTTEAAIAPALTLLGQNLYRSKSGQVANVEREAKVAEAAVVGNGRIDSVLENLRREKQNVATNLVNYTKQFSPALVRTAFENRRANQEQEEYLRGQAGAGPNVATTTGASAGPLTTNSKQRGQ